MENNLKARKKKDNLLVSLVYLSAIITVGLLVVIVGFIFIKGIAKISPNFLFADYSASGNGGISTGSTGKWLKRLNKKNVSYFCWSLSNKKESCSLLASKTRKTGNWKTKDLSKAGKYIRSKYRARKKVLGKNS